MNLSTSHHSSFSKPTDASKKKKDLVVQAKPPSIPAPLESNTATLRRRKHAASATELLVLESRFQKLDIPAQAPSVSSSAATSSSHSERSSERSSAEDLFSSQDSLSSISPNPLPKKPSKNSLRHQKKVEARHERIDQERMAATLRREAEETMRRSPVIRIPTLAEACEIGSCLQTALKTLSTNSFLYMRVVEILGEKERSATPDGRREIRRIKRDLANVMLAGETTLYEKTLGFVEIDGRIYVSISGDDYGNARFAKHVIAIATIAARESGILPDNVELATGASGHGLWESMGISESEGLDPGKISPTVFNAILSNLGGAQKEVVAYFQQEAQQSRAEPHVLAAIEILSDPKNSWESISFEQKTGIAKYLINQRQCAERSLVQLGAAEVITISRGKHIKTCFCCKALEPLYVYVAREAQRSTMWERSYRIDSSIPIPADAHFSALVAPHTPPLEYRRSPFTPPELRRQQSVTVEVTT